MVNLEPAPRGRDQRHADGSIIERATKAFRSVSDVCAIMLGLRRLGLSVFPMTQVGEQSDGRD